MKPADTFATDPVPFFSAAAVNQGRGIELAIEKVLRSGRFILGEEVLGFEAEFAHYIGAHHCVAVGNGTDALELALRALGVVAGDEVALVANAGGYGTTATLAIGARPAYVDVEPATMGMCPQALEAHLLTAKPKALIVTHLYGQLARIEEIGAIAMRHGVPLLEDCAQAHGAARHGHRAGTFGALGCFSFYPTKNLGALGDAGAVVTSDAALAASLHALRQYGWRSKYRSDVQGGRNSRMDEIQAAILRAKLPFLEADNQRRRAIASRYREALTGLPIELPSEAGESFAAHLYVVRSPRRNELKQHLLEQAVASEVHYPVPDHWQPILPGGRSTALPETQACCEAVLSLPCYPGMPDSHVDRTIAAIRAFGPFKGEA